MVLLRLFVGLWSTLIGGWVSSKLPALADLEKQIVAKAKKAGVPLPEASQQT